MRCPFCHADDDRVVNSRPSSAGTYVKRRRECNRCGRRFTTHERMEMSVLKVVKKDGKRDEFSRQKLLLGLNKACYKRAVPDERINQLADEVEQELHQRYDGEVPSEAIGELVIGKLKELDHVAYIRFASVYREFGTAQDFVKTAGAVLRGARRKPKKARRTKARRK